MTLSTEPFSTYDKDNNKVLGASTLTISYDHYHHGNHHPDHDPCQEAQEDDEEQAGEHSNNQPSRESGRHEKRVSTEQ